jgi:pimeloyl-ACP methyl ester carboxylesterase
MKTMDDIKPFTISVNQSILDDLYSRLRHTRWAYDITDADWSYGTSPKYLYELTDYWANSYDWQKHEAELNKFAQFKTDVDGTGIHFIHEQSKHANATPLLLLHGWPDSFHRFHKVIPLLTDLFHVVVPSLPGFGFSDRMAMSGDAMADIMSKLMAKLGYETYTVAGGDLGSNVAMAMAVMYPNNLKGIHLTQVNYPTGQEDFSTMTEAERKYASEIQKWLFTQGAYVMVHSTKPQSLAQGLNDSPAGLAAWALSYIDTDAQNHQVEQSFGSRDDLLTNLTIYWATETINSAIRTYAENVRSSYAQVGGPKYIQKSIVPAYIALFPRGQQFPREWAERTLNVQRFTKMPRGGHFAALEEPELYARDLRESFAK